MIEGAYHFVKGDWPKSAGVDSVGIGFEELFGAGLFFVVIPDPGVGDKGFGLWHG